MSEPVRLAKKEVHGSSKLDCICVKLCPYLLVAMIFIMTVLILYVMLQWGSVITGTEANAWYYHRGV